jgi:hypothetical protein
MEVERRAKSVVNSGDLVEKHVFVGCGKRNSEHQGLGVNVTLQSDQGCYNGHCRREMSVEGQIRVLVKQ